jgi:hypothetical protein
MGVAASNRGSRIVARQAAAAVSAIAPRIERIAEKDEADRLRARISDLEHDLVKARRCIAELRRSKDECMADAKAEIQRGDAAIAILCKIAFSGDKFPNK